jgi:hypothetical protein
VTQPEYFDDDDDDDGDVTTDDSKDERVLPPPAARMDISTGGNDEEHGQQQVRLPELESSVEMMNISGTKDAAQPPQQELPDVAAAGAAAAAAASRRLKGVILDSQDSVGAARAPAKAPTTKTPPRPSKPSASASANYGPSLRYHLADIGSIEEGDNARIGRRHSRVAPDLGCSCSCRLSRGRCNGCSA